MIDFFIILGLLIFGSLITSVKNYWVKNIYRKARAKVAMIKRGGEIMQNEKDFLERVKQATADLNVTPEPEEKLEWFKMSQWWNHCKAVREPRKGEHWGRCELVEGHEGDHALERGMDIPRWSTEWTG